MNFVRCGLRPIICCLVSTHLITLSSLLRSRELRKGNEKRLGNLFLDTSSREEISQPSYLTYTLTCLWLYPDALGLGLSSLVLFQGTFVSLFYSPIIAYNNIFVNSSLWFNSFASPMALSYGYAIHYKSIYSSASDESRSVGNS